ncbi:venom prothrombin activator porpharin-D-like [Pangasianodon hypophthalmus]|uniref:venom prothrombin activator porpharin-D-like n=1 Tax=Pangasianodon hypophthalmus TaxID=310915 RepID=UPI002307A5C2|nr:venom prothrombin activator porpharin-D-like [Pangasianodon hypophthalmus]XP_053085734.1 venom prothrombin activator porpharin-D-like [Pangasianodon hypophthalmus]
MRKDATRRRPERSLRTTRKSFDLGTPRSENLTQLDGDQCKPNPCQHGGTCKDKIGGYSCKCTDMYTGHNCENDVSECPSGGPLVCEHYCRPLPESYRCFCARGYSLRATHLGDPCGNVRVSSDSTSRNMTQNDPICPQGKCPWQVTFVDVFGDVICHGVILGRRSILTTAACMTTDKDLSLIIGHSNEKINASQVTKRTLHNRYLTLDPDDDLADCFGSGHHPALPPRKKTSEKTA